MKTIIIRKNIADGDRAQALQVARDWEKYHDKPGQQKHKTILDKNFIVHETKSGTIIVNRK